MGTVSQLIAKRDDENVDTHNHPEFMFDLRFERM